MLTNRLLGQDLTLHVLTDHEFLSNKTNPIKQLLGIDAQLGYTAKDFKGRVVGDQALRRQAKLPKSALGSCAGIALQTNGFFPFFHFFIIRGNDCFNDLYSYYRKYIYVNQASRHAKTGCRN